MRARRRFGQHFLEPAWVAKLIAAVEPRPDDVFVEIGAGRGALTRPLAARVERVIAVEIDRDLAAALEAERLPNVEIISGDILEVDLAAVLRGIQRPVRIVGNLPYNVSSPILFRLIAVAREVGSIGDATLMLQKEVVDRLVAAPGTGEYGVLGICVGLYADAERLLQLPPGAFRPPPKVTSAAVRLRFRHPRVPLPDPALFESLVRAIFSHRRKTVGNALRAFADAHGRPAGMALAEAAIDPGRRPETLEVAELARLAAVFAAG